MFVPIFIIPGLHGRDASYSQNGEFELTNIKSISFRSTITTGWLLHISIETNDSHVLVVGFDRTRGVIAYIDGAEIWEITPV